MDFFRTEAPGRHSECPLYRLCARSKSFRAASGAPRRLQRRPKERTFDDRNFTSIPAPASRGRGPPGCEAAWFPLPSNSPPLMGSAHCLRANSSLGPGLKPRPSFRYMGTRGFRTSVFSRMLYLRGATDSLQYFSSRLIDKTNQSLQETSLSMQQYMKTERFLDFCAEGI